MVVHRGQHRDIIRVSESIKNLSGKNSLNIAKASGEHCLSIRPSSHGKAIDPFHIRSNFWNGQIGCSHRNRKIAYQLRFVFRRERNSSVDMFSISFVFI